MTQPEKVLAVLEEFKARDQADVSAVLLARSDPHFQAMLLAWPKVPVGRRAVEDKPPVKPAERWGWLWRNYSFSMREWAEMAGITDARYGVALAERIVKLRLVYPDGTFPNWIGQYIRMSVVGILRRQQAKPPKQDKDKDKGDDEGTED